MKDPTHDEMAAFLASQPFADEFDEFDVEEAIYWFAYHYHGGASSNLYSALSTSSYSPGPIATGPETDLLYDDLVAEFG